MGQCPLHVTVIDPPFYTVCALYILNFGAGLWHKYEIGLTN